MKRRRRHRPGATTAFARTVIESAGHGHCTRAYEALGSAQEAYGASKAGERSNARGALGEARQTFFRRCVVPQR